MVPILPYITLTKTFNRILKFVVILFSVVSILLLILGWGTSYFLSPSELQKIALNELKKSFKTWGFSVSNVEIKEAQWGGFWNPLSLKFENISGEFSPLFPHCKMHIQQVQLGIKFTYFFKNGLPFSEIDLKNVNFYCQEKSITHLSFRSIENNGKMKITFDEINSDPAHFQDLFFENNQLLSGLQLPFSARGTFVLDTAHFSDLPINPSVKDWGNYLKKTILSADFDVKLTESEGNLSIPPVYPISLAIKRLNAKFQLENQHFYLKSLDLIHEGTTVSFHGDIDYKDLKNIGIRLIGQAKQIPVDRLSILWPEGLAASARTWVVENISVGSAEKATLSMEGKLILDPIISFNLERLSGIIDAENITVRYLDNLPLVKGAYGQCQYTQENFCIQAKGTVNGLNIEKSDIVISDFDQDEQQIKINLLLSGPVDKALEIISYDPLNLTQKLGIEHPKIFKGDSLTDLSLHFPLVKGLPLEKINVITRSDISNGYVISENSLINVSAPYNKKPMENAFFHLVVDNHQLNLEGEARLLNFPSKIHWIERFFPKITDFRSEWVVDSYINLDENNLSTAMYQGETTLKITHKTRENKSGVCSLKSNLKNVRISIPYLLLLNGHNHPLDVSFEATFDKNNVFQFSQAKLIGESISMSASGEFDLENFRKIHLDVQQFGNIEGNFNISGNHRKPKIKGHIKQLDFQRILTDPTLFDPQDPFTLDCMLDLTLDKIVVGDKLSFDHIVCQLHWADNHLQSAHFKGKAPELFELMLAPSKKKAGRFSQPFSFISSDAGNLLDCFYPDNDLEGGTINMVGVRYEDMDGKSSIEAELDIRDVMVKKAPFLAQLLSAASLEGLINTLSGSGIQFDHCTGKFCWTPESIKLDNIHFSGGSIGLQVEGDIYQKTLNIKGEIYPFNGLNYLMANIPIVGTILSGGNKKGIFSTSFTAFGKRETPHIIINPLTTIAPGVIRQVMPD